MSKNSMELPFITTVRSAINSLQKLPSYKVSRQSTPVNTPQIQHTYDVDVDPSSSSVENKDITVPFGATFEIHRLENETTGYQWTATTSSGLSIVDEKYLFDCPAGIMGCGGTVVWTVKTIEKGTQSFSAVYKRSWEPNPVRVLNITVQVT